MGMAIPFALKFEQRHDKWVWYRVYKRGFLLAFIGLLLNFLVYLPNTATQPDKHYVFLLRIPGILQRTGICYAFVASLYLLIENLWVQLGIYTSFVIIYLGFQFGYPVPAYYDFKTLTYTPCGKGILSEECK